MAADTGPIGGNLSHEFIILADTGESKIFTDKRIFELTSDGTNVEKESLDNLRKKYEKFYAVTDEKFNVKEFEEKVSHENRYNQWNQIEVVPLACGIVSEILNQQDI